MNKDECAKLITVMSATFPERKIPDPDLLVEVYMFGLEDIPFELGSGVVAKLCRENKWFPKIAEIREAAMAIAYPIPSPDGAYAIVLAEMKRVGPRGMYSFPYDAISASVREVGWWELFNSERPEKLADNFRRIYAEKRAKAIEVVNIGEEFARLGVEQGDLPRLRVLA